MTKADSNTERLYKLLGALSPDLLADAFPEAGGLHNAPSFRARHARRIGKMIALYAACVLLFLGALWLIPGLFPRLGDTPVGTDRTNDTTPIVTTAPVTTAPVTTIPPTTTLSPEEPPLPTVLPSDDYIAKGNWVTDTLDASPLRQEIACIRGDTNSPVFYPATQTELSFSFASDQHDFSHFDLLTEHLYVVNPAAPMLDVLLDGVWYRVPWEAEPSATSVSLLEYTRQITLQFSLDDFPRAYFPDGQYRFVMEFTVRHEDQAPFDGVVYVPFAVDNGTPTPSAPNDLIAENGMPYLYPVSSHADVRLDRTYVSESDRERVRKTIREFLSAYESARSTLNTEEALQVLDEFRASNSLKNNLTARIEAIRDAGYTEVRSKLSFDSLYTEYDAICFSAIETVEYYQNSVLTETRILYHDLRANSLSASGLVTITDYYFDPFLNQICTRNSPLASRNTSVALAVRKVLPEGTTLYASVTDSNFYVLYHELNRLNAFDITVTATVPEGKLIGACADVWITADGRYVKVVWKEAEETSPPEKSPYEQCLDRFLSEYAKIGKSLQLTENLTPDELADVMKFLAQTDARLVVAGGYVSYYRPEDISMYDMLYAVDTKTEYPDNPLQNDGSMMSVTRIREIIHKYMGIEVTEAMWDRLVADSATYYPEYDAYGFPHTDAWGFFPQNISGYRCADGKLLVYSGTIDNDINMILLIPTDEGYLIEAVQRVPSWELD
ncbi:MAG: hypothetical protein IJW62_02180 [Clostridia bacterium]|nr:hypothetical protein [Clostridia bacterium]